MAAKFTKQAGLSVWLFFSQNSFEKVLEERSKRDFKNVFSLRFKHPLYDGFSSLKMSLKAKDTQMLKGIVCSKLSINAQY